VLCTSFCMAIKVVTFDFWNTLGYRAIAPEQDPVRKLPTDLGLVGDKTVLNKKFEIAIQTRKDWPSRREGYKAVCVAWNIEPTNENADYIARARDEAELTVTPYEHVPNMLDQLADQGLQLALLSNSSIFAMENARIAMSDAFFDRFDFLAMSYDVGTIKPHQALFDYVLSQAKCEAHEAVMIGDKLEDDVNPALDLGWNAIWYNHKERDYTGLKDGFKFLGIHLK
jgi:HAD superfamily hydrolase (TIGR01549 family)